MIEVAQAEELRKALNEHLEITRNATARTYATLSYDEAARLLEQAEEEKEADKTFSGLAEKLHVEALEAGNNSAGRGEEAQPKRPSEEAQQGTERGARTKSHVFWESRRPKRCAFRSIQSARPPNTADTV